MVTMTTDPHVTLQQPVVVTSSKANAGPPILKTALGGQGKKLVGKGKGVKPTDKGKETCCYFNIRCGNFSWSLF